MPTPINASDGTDHQYNKHGREWRVRVRIHTELPSNAPVNGDQAVEASGLGLIISVALMDGDNVATAPDGKLRIFPPHVLTIDAEALGRINPDEEIERTIDERIDEANNQLAGKDQLHAALARFKKAD